MTSRPKRAVKKIPKKAAVEAQASSQVRLEVSPKSFSEFLRDDVLPINLSEHTESFIQWLGKASWEDIRDAYNFAYATSFPVFFTEVDLFLRIRVFTSRQELVISPNSSDDSSAILRVNGVVSNVAEVYRLFKGRLNEIVGIYGIPDYNLVAIGTLNVRRSQDFVMDALETNKTLTAVFTSMRESEVGWIPLDRVDCSGES